MKTSELIGPALDWAVWFALRGERGEPCKTTKFIYMNHEDGYFCPSTNPAQAWPIIDHYGISIIRCDDEIGVGTDGFANNTRIPKWCAVCEQQGTTSSTEHQSHDEMFQIIESEVVYGPTALVGAMRCYVLSLLGPEIDVPEELK